MKPMKGTRFSELIREARIEKGLTIRDLEAEMREHGGLTLSRTLISFLETERRKPTYEVAYALAEVLEIDVNSALSAAFQTRRRFDISREKKDLEDLVSTMNLESVNIKTIMGNQGGGSTG